MIIKSVLSTKLDIRESIIHGKGAFAKEKICKGEVVAVKGGRILNRKEMVNLDILGTIDSYWPLDDNYFLAALNPEESESIKVYINHSCEPNCGLKGQIVCVAMRDIQENEEVTFDYAMLDNESYQFECHCGATDCRNIITGFDWKKPKLQEKYGNYFALYLMEKICDDNK
ncbi:SET domain-containing protein-lysine N-methyltransferase [Bacteroidia bacterium]|nr:SET domain-containing protein-lysine N-methyltransferase [Bacteroidia bacterium]